MKRGRGRPKGSTIKNGAKAPEKRRKYIPSKTHAERSHIPRHRHIPDGTDKELEDAYLKAMEYQITLLNYADKEEGISDEELAFQKRYIHFLKNGPRKGRFTVYNKAKLTYPDVIYILSVKKPRHILAKQFGVAEGVIQRIREGKAGEWKEEYDLVRRLRRAVMCKYKKNFLDTHITLLTNANTGEVIALFSSKKKAEEYRREYLIHNQKMKKEIYERQKKSGEIDLMFPIEERTMTL